MIKTLYFRVVLTYLVAVIIGLVSTFYIALSLIETIGDQYANRLQRNLMKDGISIQKLYRANGIDHAEIALEEEKLKKKYEVRVYDSTGKLKTEVGNPPADLYIISDEVVRSVLDGGTYRGMEVAPTELVVGLPHEESGEKYALFIQISEGTVVYYSLLMLFIALIFNLLVGCFIIFIGARYLVKPLRGMKAAAERMAKGEFDIELKWEKRKDELGQLAKSFNYMASEMKQLETMRQNFVSNVSHEIQSPLTSISGFSKALQRDDLTDDERKLYLTIIQNESERLSRLSDNLLKLASLDSQRHPFEPSLYDLDEQIRKAVLSSEPLWSAKSLEWRLDLPKTKIKADEDQLNQVWINLIGNSIKFTPEGGIIHIRIVQHMDLIEVFVADNGIGIPLEDQRKVFERFYKSDQSHNKNQPGSGLGLAIVKKIVTRHRGTVTLNHNPGGGTIVTVMLPHRI
ncbi:HAMP domain-containing sensor histidine kinase [Cohnella herbarum]|uniref:Heme sensor protein HssS n=1 Tax=Cohnella herbarum TaxID=2728023 RepID=A0A7Z2ZKC0_9BACL|nr:HAMP domain-containing sensor histidine kinase [Cohnella herbarum]QJD82609.1 HAMP domain-containing histidine kinase [Cohnella herbarum]